jgi:hypothetical protein
MLIAFAFILVCSSPSDAATQDENALDSPDALDQTVDHLSVYYANLADGELAELRAPGSIKFSGMPEVALLKNENVRTDLELIPQQCTDLDRLFAILEKSALSLYDYRLREEPAARQFLRNAADVLLPHQQKRLRQLFNRYSVDHLGLPENLIQQRLGYLLKVTPEQRKEIKKVKLEVGSQLRQNSQKLRRDIIDQMLDVFDSSQKKKFDTLSQGFVDLRLPPLEILAWQLEHPDAYRDVLADRIFSQYRGFTIQPYYYLDVDQTFRLFAMNHSDKYDSLAPELRAKVDEDADTECIPRLVFTLHKIEIATALQLNDEQFLRFSDCTSQFSKFHENWNQKLANYDVALAKLGKNPLYNQYVAEQKQLVKGMLNVVETTLSYEQKDGLELLSKRLELIRGGLLHSLIYGELRKDLDFTNNQRIEIVEVGEKCLKKIQRQSLAWEKEAHERLFKVLNPEQVEKIEELLGPPLEHDRANIDVLITQFLLSERIALQSK